MKLTESRLSLPSLFGWSPEDIDEALRWQGRILESLGYGPIESPWRSVLRKPVLSLRAYTDSHPQGPVVLIIPAPIKKAYIWDLAPNQSAVRQLVRGGAQVYLVNWEEPGADEYELGLADYSDRLLLDCVRAIQAETGQDRLFLAGHSLGGTLAAIFTLLHPDYSSGLILIESPLKFGSGIDALSTMVALSPPATVLTRLLGRTVPGAWLDLTSMVAAPETFLLEPQLDLMNSSIVYPALVSHLRSLRWMLDETPFTPPFFEQLVEYLYREDRLTRGQLTISGKRILPEQLEAPLLCVAEMTSSVAPPASMLALYESASSKDKRWLWYQGDIGVRLQHVGVLVGQNAHRQIWPEIVAWLRNH